MTNYKGFTLVEILIVVIILGILAAIVIPQFSAASNDARESSLVSDLQTLRSQLELYKVQHMDHYPNEVSTDDGETWSDDTANFEARLTGQTDRFGQTTGTDFGPYLQKIPTNAFNGLATIEVDGTAGDSSAGWNFDSTDNKVQPDDAMTSPDGTAHIDL